MSVNQRVGAAVVVIVAVAVGVTLLLLRDEDNERPADATANPTTAAAQLPATCPVDDAICDFADLVEHTYHESDLRDLLSPKSSHFPETGVLRAAGIALGGPLQPRVMAIGCPIDLLAAECSDAFSLVLTSYPPAEQDARESRVLLGFLRDGGELPIVTTNVLAGGIDVVANGGDFGRCDMSGRAEGSECAGTRFHPWSSGPEVLRSPTPSPAPSPAAGDPLAGVDVVELKPGMQSSIGYDTVVYYSNGCYGCGRPRIPGLFRAYRDSAGELHSDDLFGPLFASVGGYPQSVAADLERGHILVLVCETGYCGGEGDPSRDASVRIFRSRDGGVTFAEEDASGIAVESYFSGLIGDEAIVRSTEQRGGESVLRSFLFPSMTTLAPPAGIGKAEPFPDGRGHIAWLSYDPPAGLYDSDGALVVPASPLRRLVSVVPLPVGMLAKWSGNGGGETFAIYGGAGEIVRVLHSDSLSDFRGQLANGLLIANVTLAGPFGFGVDGGGAECKNAAASYASLVNWNTGTVHPIMELGDCEGLNQHRYVNAIVARPVVRVNTPGDCLNMRTEPTIDSAVLGCFADGVLLPLRLEGSPAAVPGWVPVLSPNLETAGWVADPRVSR